MIRTATKKPRIRASILTAAAGLGLFALACDTPIPQSPADPERASRVEGVVGSEGVVRVEGAIGSGTAVGLEAAVGMEAEIRYVDEDGTYRVHKGKWAVDPEAGFGYVDEDGVFQAIELDPEAKARIGKTVERLERAKREIEMVRGRLDGRFQAGDITRDLWLSLEGVMERIGELTPRLEEFTTELAMEVRRLHAAVEAGEITHDEAERILRTHMEAHNARLRLRDKPH